MYVQSILNKITGNAKDALCLAGNPLDFMGVKKILIEAFGDRQELASYKAQLWSNKQSDDTSIHVYYMFTHKTFHHTSPSFKHLIQLTCSV